MTLKINGTDITSLVGGITLESNLDTLGDKLDFEVANAVYLKYPIKEGDGVQLFDGTKEIFSGIVVTKTTSVNSRSFNCFDFAFYLNKSKTIKQFYKIKTDVAIKQLLSEFNVPVGKIASMPTLITKVYYDKEVSEVLKDILEESNKATGEKCIMEMNGGKLDVYKDTEKVIKVMVKIAPNTAPVDTMATINEPTKSTSIEDMKNSIKLYVGNEDKVKVYAEVKNNTLIQKYGLLQETQSLEEKDIAQAKNIAKNLLKELGKVSETADITVLGSFDLRAGRIIKVVEPLTEINGTYRIKSASHTIGQTHTTKLNLEVV